MHENLSAPHWRELVGRLLRTEMAKRKLKYEDLSRLLATAGIRQSAANLRNKINRGIMGADLFLAIMLVLDVQKLERETILEILDTLS